MCFAMGLKRFVIYVYRFDAVCIGRKMRAKQPFISAAADICEPSDDDPII